MVDICQYSFLQTPSVHDAKREPVYCGLQEVTMGSMRFVNCNKAVLVEHVDNQGGYVCICRGTDTGLCFQLDFVMHLMLLKIKFIKKNQFRLKSLPTYS